MPQQQQQKRRSGTGAKKTDENKILKETNEKLNKLHVSPKLTDFEKGQKRSKEQLIWWNVTVPKLKERCHSTIVSMDEKQIYKDGKLWMTFVVAINASGTLCRIIGVAARKQEKIEESSAEKKEENMAEKKDEENMVKKEEENMSKKKEEDIQKQCHEMGIVFVRSEKGALHAGHWIECNKIMDQWATKHNCKIAIIQDNFSGHTFISENGDVYEPDNIMEVFLPSQSTAALQPFDNGVSQKMEKYYNEHRNTVKTEMDAIKIMNDALKELTQEEVIGCFAKTGIIDEAPTIGNTTLQRQ